MENPPSPRRVRNHSLVQGQAAQGQEATGAPCPVEKTTKDLHYCPDTCYRCGKGRHQKAYDYKAVEATCRGCGKKGHYEKVCLKGKHSTHPLKVPLANSAGAGAGEPLYFSDGGQPVYTYIERDYNPETPSNFHYHSKVILIR